LFFVKLRDATKATDSPGIPRLHRESNLQEKENNIYIYFLGGECEVLV
jgi:hypothetical protein